MKSEMNKLQEEQTRPDQPSLPAACCLMCNNEPSAAVFLALNQILSLFVSVIAFTDSLSGFSSHRGDFMFLLSDRNVKLQRKTGSVQSDLGQPTCFRACRPAAASLHTNTPALPHSSHFRPRANEQQIFVFILNRKTLNAARLLLLLLLDMCVHIFPR